jgi:ribonuclease HII
MGMKVSKFHIGIIIQNMKLIIGIDEAGRGPLAGPVTVGIFMAKQKMGPWLLQNIFSNKLRDSKKLSPQKREEIYKKFLELKKENKISFSVSHISNKIIDKVGISEAIQNGINKSLKKINLTPNPSPRIRRGEKGKIYIRLDGLLKAPKEFKNQKTIIKGDEKDVFIACASIVAKVSRDRLMCRLAKKHPNYGFEIHKGYGTTLHRKAIQKNGLSSLHRHSFCKNLTLTPK